MEKGKKENFILWYLEFHEVLFQALPWIITDKAHCGSAYPILDSL